MDLAKAQEILRGYMSPRSQAINIFVQTGRITESLENEVMRELQRAGDEMRRRGGDLGSNTELVVMNRELVEVLEWLGDTSWSFQSDTASDSKLVSLSLFGYEAAELKAILEVYQSQMRIFSRMKHATVSEVELYQLKSAFAESLIARIEALETE